MDHEIVSKELDRIEHNMRVIEELKKYYERYRDELLKMVGRSREEIILFMIISRSKEDRLIKELR